MMLRTAISAFVILAAGTCLSQVSAVSPGKSFASKLNADVTCSTDSADNSLEAGGKGEVKVVIDNVGASPAHDVVVTANPDSPISGITLERELRVGDILPGARKETSLHFAAADTVAGQQVKFSLTIRHAGGKDTVRKAIAFTLKANAPPLLNADLTLRSRRWGELSRLRLDDTVDISVAIQNRGAGKARDLQAQVLLLQQYPSLSLLCDSSVFVIGDLSPGKARWLRFGMFTGGGFRGDSIDIGVRFTGSRLKHNLEQVFHLRYYITPADMEKRGRMYLEEKAFDKAIRNFEMALNLDSSSAGTYYYLGLAQVGANNRTEAITSMNRAARKGDKNARAWLEQNAPRRPGVSYSNLEPNPFKVYHEAVALGILGFKDKNGNIAPVTEKLFQALSSRTPILERFFIFSYPSLLKQQNDLGISSLDAADNRVLRALGEKLDIKFILIGDVHSANPEKVFLRLVRTADGAVVFERQFQDSETSTALNDMVKVFEESKVPRYKTE